MLKSLLIGVNGSQWSKAAAEFGLDWARSSNLPVTFLGIVDVEGLTGAQPVPIGGGGFKAERDAQVLAAARARVATALDEARARAGELGVECDARIVEGSPAGELGLEVQRHDLMIIGKRAVPESDRDPAASATMTDIVRHAARPIVVSGGFPPDSERVIVAYDGSSQAARALGSFVMSGMHADLPVHLVGVGKEHDAVREKLRRAEDYLAVHGRETEAHVLPVGDGISATLRGFIERTPARLLVMGVYGEPHLKALLFGSVTRSMLAAVPLPMFLDH